jgi:hypothetical protein
VIGPPPVAAKALTVAPNLANETVPVSVGKLFELRVSTRFAPTAVCAPAFALIAVKVPLHCPVTLPMFVAANEIVVTPHVMVPASVWLVLPKETAARLPQSATK